MSGSPVTSTASPVGIGGGATNTSEGPDQTVTTLTGVALAPTYDAGAVAFVSWACTAAPGAGDPGFPDGTTTGAVTAAIASATSAITTVDLPGPGRYVLTATWNDGTTETLSIYATRPLPAISSDLSSGTVNVGDPAAPVLSSPGDGLVWSTTATKLSGPTSITVTGNTTSTPTWTWPSGGTSGETVEVGIGVVDVYGRTDSVTTAHRVIRAPITATVTQAEESVVAGLVSWTIAASGGVGTLSYALQGSLTKPAGSAATVVDDTTTTPDVTLDEDGVYTFTIRISDEDGQTLDVACWAYLDTTDEGMAGTSHAIYRQTTLGLATITWPAVTGNTGALSYATTDYMPAGSSTTSSGDDPTTTLTPDIAGAYIVEREATDATTGYTYRQVGVVEVVLPAPTPPVLTAPADPAINVGDAAPTLTFTNGGGAVVSTVASIVSKPAGSSASLTHSTPSLAPVLNYDLAGDYAVRLDATNADGSDGDVAIVSVASFGPTADAGADQIGVADGSTVNLSAAGSSAQAPRTITGRLWSFAANSPDTATLSGETTEDCSFTAAANETYLVDLLITDSEGETDTDQVLIRGEALTRDPVLVWSQDLTTATCDADSWVVATASGSITADSGATPIATWTKSAASGNSTNVWGFEVGANGFGITRAQWSGVTTSLGLSARIDFDTLPSLDWDLDGVIVQMLVKRTYSTSLPTGTNSEFVEFGIAPDGAAHNAAHESVERHYQDSGGKDMYRRTAATANNVASSVAWSATSVVVVRLDRSNVTIQVKEGATALLDASVLDSTAYDYTSVGASAVTPGTAGNNPWDAGIAAVISLNSKAPISDGGEEINAWVSAIEVYTSGVAQ